MHECFNNLLVTCPNGGGLMLLHEGKLYQLDSLDSTGLSVQGRYVMRGIQPATAVIQGSQGNNADTADIFVDDIHDVLIEGEECYLVGTSGNEIVKYGIDGAELQRWSFPGDADSWHINCLARWNERLVFCAFGEFQRQREYKGKSLESGFVQDLLTGERLIQKLSQPHSLVVIGENLLVANSEMKELVEYDCQGRRVRERSFEGYVRGVLATGEYIFVGLSRSRNIAETELRSAVVVALDRDTWAEVARTDVPADEIYAIQSVRPGDLPVILARIAGHASAWFGGKLKERDDRLALLDARLSERERYAEKLDKVESALTLLSGKYDGSLSRMEGMVADLHSKQDSLLSELSLHRDRIADLSVVFDSKVDAAVLGVSNDLAHLQLRLREIERDVSGYAGQQSMLTELVANNERLLRQHELHERERAAEAAARQALTDQLREAERDASERAMLQAEQKHQLEMQSMQRSNLAAERDALRLRLERAEQVAQEQSVALQEILKSRSWRMTSWLRRLSMLFKKAILS